MSGLLDQLSSFTTGLGNLVGQVGDAAGAIASLKGGSGGGIQLDLSSVFGLPPVGTYGPGAYQGPLPPSAAPAPIAAPGLPDWVLPVSIAGGVVLLAVALKGR